MARVGTGRLEDRAPVRHAVRRARRGAIVFFQAPDGGRSPGERAALTSGRPRGTARGVERGRRPRLLRDAARGNARRACRRARTASFDGVVSAPTGDRGASETVRGTATMTAENPRDDGKRVDVPTGTEYPTDVLVSPDWVEARLDQFAADDPDLRLLEVDVNTAFYDTAHVPGAACVDWRTDLRSADSHDILAPDEMASFLGSHGITTETTVVVYGDNSNWFAAHLYWQLTYYGHPDVRIMDGGREYWMDYGYPTTTGPVEPPTATYGGSLAPPARPEVRAY